LFEGLGRLRIGNADSSSAIECASAFFDYRGNDKNTDGINENVKEKAVKGSAIRK
jgi:hypothetical protein